MSYWGVWCPTRQNMDFSDIQRRLLTLEKLSKFRADIHAKAEVQ